MLGCEEGSNDGSPLGTELGFKDGEMLVLGPMLGSPEGWTEEVGTSLALCDGTILGCDEGSDDGLPLGLELGFKDGEILILGLRLGSTDGWIEDVGTSLGL